MITKILQYLLQKWTNRESLKLGGLKRSNQWPRIRKEWLKENPNCAICNKNKLVVPHHKLPFNKFPDLELEKSNLISLCESAGMNCHITFGHLSDFKFYNPNIETDAPIWKDKIEKRLKLN